MRNLRFREVKVFKNSLYRVESGFRLRLSDSRGEALINY